MLVLCCYICQWHWILFTKKFSEMLVFNLMSSIVFHCAVPFFKHIYVEVVFAFYYLNNLPSYYMCIPLPPYFTTLIFLIIHQLTIATTSPFFWYFMNGYVLCVREQQLCNKCLKKYFIISHGDFNSAITARLCFFVGWIQIILSCGFWSINLSLATVVL